MTIPEEIEQLKIMLERSADEKEKAEILLEILQKYSSINFTESQVFIDRLMQLAEKLNQTLYKAWGFYYLAILRRIKAEYDVSMDFSLQALSLFEQLNEKRGIAQTYSNIGRVYELQDNYAEALKNHFTSLKIEEEIRDDYNIANSYSNIGIVYRQQGNYTEALKNQYASLKIREEIGDKNGLANSYGHIGSVCQFQGNYSEALRNYFASLRIKEETGDNDGIAAIYNNIGIVHEKQGNYPEALRFHFASLKIREKIGGKRGISSSYINIGMAYEGQGNYSEALQNYFTSLKISEEIGSPYSMACAYNNIGTVQYEQDNYPEALKNFFASLKIREEIGDYYGIAASYTNIGNIYKEKGDYPESLKNTLAAFQMAEKIKSKDIIKEVSISLAQIYKAQGDFENALKFHEKFHQVESEILGERAQKRLTQLNFQHNMEQKEKDLEIEQLRNVELKKERERSESLLLNILPPEVAEELKDKGKADAKLFDNVTVLFTDFKSFTTKSERLTPQQLVDELHSCFSAFDEITGRYGIEKIKTVGDAYLAVGGLPLPNASHAQDVVKAAIEIQHYMLTRKSDAPFGGLGAVRIGVHSGSVVAGIVGIKKYAYDIWGDTVNTAARMEQNSEAGKINISETTYQLVKDNFNCKYRGEIEAKNKGSLKMYFVN